MKTVDIAGNYWEYSAEKSFYQMLLGGVDYLLLGVLLNNEYVINKEEYDLVEVHTKVWNAIKVVRSDFAYLGLRDQKSHRRHSSPVQVGTNLVETGGVRRGPGGGREAGGGVRRQERASHILQSQILARIIFRLKLCFAFVFALLKQTFTVLYQIRFVDKYKDIFYLLLYGQQQNAHQ